MGKKRDTLSYPSLDEGLYKLMRKAGFNSVEQLAEKSGVSPRTIFNCHHKLRIPTPGTVALLAEALGISRERLRKELAAPE
jgi:transcriptional regulator with XRE-family HTH domain